MCFTSNFAVRHYLKWPSLSMKQRVGSNLDQHMFLSLVGKYVTVALLRGQCVASMNLLERSAHRGTRSILVFAT